MLNESTTVAPNVDTRAHCTSAPHCSNAPATRCSRPIRSAARSYSTTAPVASSSKHSTFAGGGSSGGPP